MRPVISYISFYKLIMSSESYKKAYEELTERLQNATPNVGWRPAEYLEGIQVSFYCRCDLEFQGLNSWQEVQTIKYVVSAHPKVAVVGKRNTCNNSLEAFKISKAVREVFQYLLKILYNTFLDNLDNVRSIKEISLKVDSEKYDAIEIEIDSDTLIAWHWDHVFIWHEEQECGEGWIMAPRDPERIQEQTTIQLT